MSEEQDRLSNRDVITLKHKITLSDSDEEELTSVPFDPDVKTLSSSDDEDECVGDDGGGGEAAGRLMSSGQSATFSLKGGSTSFSSRSRNIFDSLDSAAKVTSSALGQDNVIDGVFARPPPPPPLASNAKRPRGGGESKTDRPPLRDSSGPVSSFQTGGGAPHDRDSSGPVSSFRTGGGAPHGRDSGRPRRGGGVPDYLLHPEKWTCYSLEDVPDSSDADNSATAHQYLSSLQRRKERMADEEEEEDEAFIPAYNQGQNSDQTDCRSSQHKILFSRPGRGREQQKVSAGREKEKALCHLEEDKGKEGVTEKAGERARNVSDEEEEEEGRPTIRPPGAQDRKRKQQAGSEEMEEDEEEHEKNPRGFVPFRKSSNRKNYRRTSEQDD